MENLSETNVSMLGGGVGIGFGIRSSDDKSTGVMLTLKHMIRPRIPPPSVLDGVVMLLILILNIQT